MRCCEVRSCHSKHTLTIPSVLTFGVYTSLKFCIISHVNVRGPDKTATSTTMPKGKYTESLTFSNPNCIYANYEKLGKPSLQCTPNVLLYLTLMHMF